MKWCLKHKLLKYKPYTTVFFVYAVIQNDNTKRLYKMLEISPSTIFQSSLLNTMNKQFMTFLMQIKQNNYN